MTALVPFLRRLLPDGPAARVWWLTVLASIGITAVLPILPLFVTEHGADVHVIGWMMASYFAANLFFLPLGGWLSDHVGRRRVMTLGLGAHALASAGFIVFRDTTAFLALRAIDGAAGACLLPAALAYVADRSPAGRQGRQIAGLAAAENIGILIGPVIGGGLVAALGLDWPFVFLTVLCLLGLFLLRRLPESRVQDAAPRDRPGSAATWRDVDWIVAVGLSLRNLSAGFSFGLYEVVWSLYLHSLGASVWQITLTWTAFALPSLLLAPLAGRIIDRFGAGRPAVFGASVSAIVTLFYVQWPDPWALIALSAIEGVGFAFNYPAHNALMIQLAPEALRGRVIGAVSALRTVGAMTAAMLTSRLYAHDPWQCFAVTAAVLAVGSLSLGLSLMVAERRKGSSAGTAAETTVP